MKTVLHIGPVGTFEQPTLGTDGAEIVQLFDSGPKVIATIRDRQVYRADSESAEPIATFDGSAVYGGTIVLHDPIATIEGSEIYAGRRGVTDDPIATVQGDQRNAGALAAAFILLM